MALPVAVAYAELAGFNPGADSYETQLGAILPELEELAEGRAA